MSPSISAPADSRELVIQQLAICLAANHPEQAQRCVDVAGEGGRLDWVALQLLEKADDDMCGMIASVNAEPREQRDIALGVVELIVNADSHFSTGTLSDKVEKYIQIMLPQ